jgi:serine/threonine-protein kinase
LGLAVQEGDKVFSETEPAGVVMSQSPRSNSTLRPGEVVTLVLSQGPSKVMLPSVVGKTFGEAQAQLEAIGLTVEQRREPKVGARQEEVVGQEPPAGTQVARGQTVVLIVNPGGIAQVPAVYGKTEAEARTLIEAAGFKIPLFGINRQNRHNTDIPIAQLEAVCRGCVLSVSPPAGTVLQPGSEVRLGVRDPND